MSGGASIHIQYLPGDPVRLRRAKQRDSIPNVGRCSEFYPWESIRLGASSESWSVPHPAEVFKTLSSVQPGLIALTVNLPRSQRYSKVNGTRLPMPP